MRIGIVYHSTEGHTADIVEGIASVLGEGNEVESVPVDRADGLEHFDAVIVGGPIHVGKHDASLAKFVRSHLAELEAKPSAFFSVSLSASSEKTLPDAQRVVDQFFTDTGWHPAQMALFGGAVLYTKYGFLKRHAMRHIVGSQGGETDTSRDFDYTDWEAVEHFARDFGAWAAEHARRG
jgi:menaquinone-dependent protoporphyrinogen oxidase